MSAKAEHPCRRSSMLRVSEFDGLRGLAALVVVIFHLSYHRWLPWGWAAVDLFFVLSGYLITGIILRERENPKFYRSFFLRRALRIWPIYYCTILILWLRDLAPSGSMCWHLAYLQFTPMYGLPGVAWPPPSTPGYWFELGHTWTLAIEEQFYLLWPFVGFMAGRRLAWVAVALWAICVALRCCDFAPFVLLARCDSLVVGSLLAIAGIESLKRLWQLAIIACLSCSAVVTYALIPVSENVFKFLMVALVCGAIVSACVCLRGTTYLFWLRFSPVVWLGTISYGLYLYHNVVRNYFYVIDIRVGPFSDQERFWVAFAVSTCAATLSWYLFEKPILSLKRYVEYG